MKQDKIEKEKKKIIHKQTYIRTQEMKEKKTTNAVNVKFHSEKKNNN